MIGKITTLENEISNQKIHLLNDIKQKEDYTLCIINDLNQNQRYDLEIKYTTEKIKPHHRTNISYNQLRKDILENKIVNYHQASHIYVAPTKVKRGNN